MGVKSRSSFSFGVTGTSRKKVKEKERGASLATSVLHHEVEEEQEGK